MLVVGVVGAVLASCPSAGAGDRDDDQAACRDGVQLGDVVELADGRGTRVKEEGDVRGCGIGRQL